VNTGGHAPRSSGPGGGQPGPAQAEHQERPHARFLDLLSPGDQETLRQLGQVRLFRPGEAICTQGEKATHVVVLTEGWAKIMAVTGEQHAIQDVRGRGDIVGELAGGSSGYRTADVIAAGQVRALVIAYDRYKRLLDSSPGADTAHRQVLTQRWIEAADRVRSRSAGSGAQRLAGLLLDFANWDRNPAGPGAPVTIPLSHDELASLIGASRATVTRAVGDWRRQGLIGTGRNKITVINPSGLRSAVGRHPRRDTAGDPR
jgi:CRP/FNR family transcriptional regulator, cyclic AMP receptor protein